MKKSILNLGKTLNKVEQKSINGGEGPGEGNNDGPNRRGCYEQPVTDVNCISPWIYAPGCGWVCMVAPEGP
ncbi:hypothetical protein F7018_16095 [Tenacibaculum aiptasiae]|uniref:Bacteriocin n=1 Tax=Tenacibaculum aiptasiae TaxID=426481 RepID=A0A7J5A8Z9_9FLAO|nr:hypothetical protein [Tenacibaculum aiptasiae]KAB1154005.1 hypothetical protein F7018_16095 [Tenacibaculum aiptasiae]